MIAQGLSGFEPERAGLAAGRIMLARLRELARQQEQLRIRDDPGQPLVAPWIADLMRTGYQFHLVFLWLPHPDIAVARVAARVRAGGHDVPEETIRRRYEAGQSNFFSLYQPMATTWEFWDNSAEPGHDAHRSPVLDNRALKVSDRATWELIKAGYNR